MNQLPLWFLVLTLFLPRVSLVIAYLANDLSAFNLIAWVPGIMAIIIPRALVLLVIFQATLGMWTVTMLLKPAIVTAHLALTGRGIVRDSCRETQGNFSYLSAVPSIPCPRRES